MKSLIYPCVLALILGFNCLAADPPYTNSAGEVIFYTQTAYEDPIIVTCSLAGVLFDQYATWNATVPGGHPQYDEYIHYGTNNENNMLVGSTNALTHSNGMICWESVFENDDPAPSQVCTGMIGWGRYVFAVGNENEDPEIVFTLNTIDGRWMYSTFSDKFIFKVERTPQISVSVYNWVMARWDEVTFGTNVNYNYWGNTRGGTATAVQQVTNAKIHSDFTSIADDACYRWAPQPPSGGTSAISYSDAAGMILNRVVLGFGDSAVNLTYDNIDNSMDSVELGIRMLALRSAYVFDRNAVARDTLRKYAFKPFNPGVPVDFITNTAVVNLVMAEVLLDNVEGALQAIDSVLYRSVPNEMKVHYLAKKAEIYVNDVGDSSYIAVIDSLLYLDPTNNDLLTAKYMVSGDTAYTVWYEKRGADYTSAPSPETAEIHSYPTPAMSEQTVWMDNPGEVSNVLLYDYLGREIDKSRYEYSQAGESISFVYRLDSGVYLQVIVTDKGTRVNRIVVNTAGAHR